MNKKNEGYQPIIDPMRSPRPPTEHASPPVPTYGHSLADLEKMAEIVVKAGLFGVKTVEQALALMLLSQAEQVHPMTAVREWDIIQGKACRKASSLLRRFQEAGGRVSWDPENDDQQQTGTFAHPAGGQITVTWNLERAKKAGLAGKDNWIKYAQAMMRARCITEAIRAIYPAALGGELSVEEAMDLDMPATKDMGTVHIEPAAKPKSRPAAALEKAKRGRPQKAAKEKATREAYDGLLTSLTECKTQADLDRCKDEARMLWPDLEDSFRNQLTDMIESVQVEFQLVADQDKGKIDG